MGISHKNGDVSPRVSDRPCPCNIALLIFPPHLSPPQLREYALERDFTSESENKVKSKGTKYEYSFGIDQPRKRDEVVEFVPIVPEKREKPRKTELISNEIPPAPVFVAKRRIGLSKSFPSKGFRSSSSTRSKE